MKVLYDHQIFTWQRFGGISNSFVQLIRHLPKDVDFELSVIFSDNVHLINSNLKTVKPIFKPENFLFKRGFPLKFWLYGQVCRFFPEVTSFVRNKKESIRLLNDSNFDVFHPTFFDDYFLPYLNRKPFVLTVHDMTPELFHQNDSQIILKKTLVKYATHIVTVSDRTKEDLIDILNVPKEKITTIYHGAPEISVISHTDMMDGQKYILFVGKRDGYKAFVPMIRSIAPWLKYHSDIKLVCTGNPFTEKEIRIFCDADIDKQVVHLQPDDKELGSLYKHAMCFVYPSYYEGFGIPILEAYSLDCPVFLSRCSCFPEVAGDAAVYFDIDDCGSNLPEKLDDFLLWDSEKKKAFICKQRDRLTMYSWDKSAKRLADVYEKVK